MAKVTPFGGTASGGPGRRQVTFEEVKRQYRNRMAEYHPDKAASLGAKLRELAEEETKKIKAAYEFFRTKYAHNA